MNLVLSDGQSASSGQGANPLDRSSGEKGSRKIEAGGGSEPFHRQPPICCHQPWEQHVPRGGGVVTYKMAHKDAALNQGPAVLCTKGRDVVHDKTLR